MQARRPITAHLASTIATEAAAGASGELLAQRHGLTEYVVGKIIQYHPVDQAPRSACVKRRYRPRGSSLEPALDPADVARCRRLKREGKSIDEIAEVLGLRQPLVKAALRKKPRFGPKESLRRGERYVTKPTVCPTCQMPLRVVPCRACRIRELIAAGERVWTD